jgi:hypothetical protein
VEAEIGAAREMSKIESHLSFREVEKHLGGLVPVLVFVVSSIGQNVLGIGRWVH